MIGGIYPLDVLKTCFQLHIMYCSIVMLTFCCTFTVRSFSQHSRVDVCRALRDRGGRKATLSRPGYDSYTARMRTEAGVFSRYMLSSDARPLVVLGVVAAKGPL